MLEDGDERTDVLIARDENLGAKPGDIVRVEVLEYPKKEKHAVGRVVEIVGRSDDPGIETEVAMLAHGIPHDWPDAHSRRGARTAARGAGEARSAAARTCVACRS